MPKNIRSFFVVSPNTIGDLLVPWVTAVVAPCIVVAAVTAAVAAPGFCLNRSAIKSTITTNKQGMYKIVLKTTLNNGEFAKYPPSKKIRQRFLDQEQCIRLLKR